MVNDNNITLVSEMNLLDVIEAFVLCAFKMDGNNYIIYSKNEHDYDNNSIVYCAKIEVKDCKQYIRNINSEEYNKVKDIIKKMINYNGEEYDV